MLVGGKILIISGNLQSVSLSYYTERNFIHICISIDYIKYLIDYNSTKKQRYQIIVLLQLLLKHFDIKKKEKRDSVESDAKVDKERKKGGGEESNVQ